LRLIQPPAEHFVKEGYLNRFYEPSSVYSEICGSYDVFSATRVGINLLAARKTQTRRNDKQRLEDDIH